MIAFGDYARAGYRFSGDTKIALIIAEGEITRGEAAPSLTGDETASLPLIKGPFGRHRGQSRCGSASRQQPRWFLYRQRPYPARGRAH